MRQLDIEKLRTDTLLYQMIPKSVADRLRKGEPALNTCEVRSFHVELLVGLPVEDAVSSLHLKRENGSDTSQAQI